MKKKIRLQEIYEETHFVTTDFQIDFITSDESRFLAAEISYCQQLLCRMYRRTEDNMIDIEFMDERRVLPKEVRLLFPFEEFIEVAAAARAELVALRI